MIESMSLTPTPSPAMASREPSLLPLATTSSTTVSEIAAPPLVSKTMKIPTTIFNSSFRQQPQSIVRPMPQRWQNGSTVNEQDNQQFSHSQHQHFIGRRELPRTYTAASRVMWRAPVMIPFLGGPPPSSSSAAAVVHRPSYPAAMSYSAPQSFVTPHVPGMKVSAPQMLHPAAMQTTQRLIGAQPQQLSALHQHQHATIGPTTAELGGAAMKHSCNVCGRRFKRRTTLRSHFLIHTGGKPFKCDVCDARFRQKSSLTGHRRTHFPDQAYDCTLCGQHLSRRSYLRRHLRNVHNEHGDIEAVVKSSSIVMGPGPGSPVATDSLSSADAASLKVAVDDYSEHTTTSCIDASALIEQ